MNPTEILELVRTERRRSLLTNLSLLRDEDCLTDVRLIVAGHVFPAHRLVLAANSLYFRKAFKKQPKLDKITLGDVDADVFSTVLNYLYSGRLTGPAAHDQSKTDELIFAFKSLQITNYQKVSDEVILSTLRVDTFYSLWSLAKMLNNRTVEEAIAKFVAKHLEYCCKIDDFVQLTLSQMTCIMASSFTRKRSPDVIIKAVSKWCSDQPLKREKYCHALLTTVGLKSYVDKCIACIANPTPNLVQNDATCTSLTPFSERIDSSQKLDEIQCVSAPMPPLFYSSQTDDDLPQASAATSSLCNSSKADDDLPHTSAATSLVLSNSSFTNYSASSSSQIGTIRGDGDQDDDGCEQINIDQFWENYLPPDDLFCPIDLSAERITLSARNPEAIKRKPGVLAAGQRIQMVSCPIDRSCILFIGHDDVGLPLQAFYDYNRKEWLSLDMTVRVIGNNVMTLLHQRSLYYFGGELTDHEPLDSVHVHKLDEHTLTQVSSMSVARFSVGAVFCTGKIYVIGGLSKHSVLVDAVERYNIANDTWETLPKLLFARCNPSLASTNHDLYVVSGFLDEYNVRVCSACECFNFICEQWTEICSMPTGICTLPTAITAITDDIYLIRLMKPSKIYQYHRTRDKWRVVCVCNNNNMQAVSVLNVEGWLWMMDNKQRVFKFSFKTEEWELVTRVPKAIHPPVDTFVMHA